MAVPTLSAPEAARQRSFDDLGSPLIDVTFCVIDLETTGGSPHDCAITEIGGVKLRGGVCQGTFQTMVNPGQAIPPEITVLTGITQAMVLPAPRIESVLPSLLEFVGDAVIVGHNVRFDLSFLRAALEGDQRPPLPNRSVDTAALARRLVRDEVPNCRLGTLADRLRLDHRPSHRALDDALATGDLLHVLLERAGRLGVTGLDDLLALPTIKGHDQAAKLRLTEHLPRTPGVYLFRDRRGAVLYVGKATNLRSRVRSYFSGDQRRKIHQLLRETSAIDHTACGGSLEAAVREIRLIHEHQPRFNRQAKVWKKYAYLKLTLNERFPRLSVVKVPRPDGGYYLGPLSSGAAARRVAEAIETVVPLRRCTARPGTTPRAAPCAPAQLGVATCPCAAQVGEAEYAALVDQTLRGLTTEPGLLLEPLRHRMESLAVEQRFEEAADARERARALAAALARQRLVDGLRTAGRLVVEAPGQVSAFVDDGMLVETWTDPTHQPRLELVRDPVPGDRLFVDPVDLGRHPLPRDQVDEVACIARWLDHEAPRIRVVTCDAGLATDLPALPSFEPRTPGRRLKRGA